jgi:hypothetical protein
MARSPRSLGMRVPSMIVPPLMIVSKSATACSLRFERRLSAGLDLNGG